MSIIAREGFIGSSKVMIFIDGGYLRKRISETTSAGIDYDFFARWLTHQTGRNGIRPLLQRVMYYDAIPNLEDVKNMPKEPNPFGAYTDMKKLRRKQEEHLKEIRMVDLYDVRLGKLSWNAGGIKGQKGVDSLIAVDMLTKAYQNQYDEAVLVAGDSDFVEIVKAVKSSGPQVTGAYFEENIAGDLLYEFDKRLPLTKDELLRLYILRKK